LSNHIIVQECEDSESEIELVESLQTRKGGGQSTIDNLKDLNLETTKEPCPIYVSSLLTIEEEMSTSVSCRSIRMYSHEVIRRYQGSILK